MKFELESTTEFDTWLEKLRDKRARARILSRLDRVREGNLGDTRTVESGISELRVDYGGGYRVYFNRKGSRIYLLLCGGTKGSQERDIRRAIRILNALRKDI